MQILISTSISERIEWKFFIVLSFCFYDITNRAFFEVRFGGRGILGDFFLAQSLKCSFFLKFLKHCFFFVFFFVHIFKWYVTGICVTGNDCFCAVGSCTQDFICTWRIYHLTGLNNINMSWIDQFYKSENTFFFFFDRLRNNHWKKKCLFFLCWPILTVYIVDVIRETRLYEECIAFLFGMWKKIIIIMSGEREGFLRGGESWITFNSYCGRYSGQNIT